MGRTKAQLTKDKAKLKQQQSSNQPSLDKVIPPQDQTKSGEERNTPKWNWNVSQEEHASSRASHTRQQLPLFEESPTSSETLKPQGQNTTDGALLSTRDSSLKLDLELRLGLEPQDSSPETVGYVSVTTFCLATFDLHEEIVYLVPMCTGEFF
ncbi:uncharacterized protein HKW66_Vig0140200 [Vigna angularis]|uniref:Uncharacterized protein n=1 Tax=Phaseolus angularis TaxID=3914 RepID=A0A8T0KDR8_PHAAN|nr:uncharacterized protein HKW66_Vig0140200 [Vigna angularis]